MQRIVEVGPGFYRHHYPRVAALISVRANGFDNVMPACWHIPLAQNPPLFGVVISRLQFTHGMIDAAREFAVNFVSSDKVELVAALGSTSGRDIDKFAKFGIATTKAANISSPVLADAYAAYECVLHDKIDFGRHGLFIGRIVAIHQDEEVLMADGGPDFTKVMPAIYLANDRYGAIDPDTVRLVSPLVKG